MHLGPSEEKRGVMSEQQQQQQPKGKEEGSKPQVGIQPEPNDILCGKDKACVHAPGSIRFRTIIESYRQRYANCLTKFDKMLITKEIYETLSQSSRFLKFNPKEKSWEEISPMAARDKCGHALRFANRLKSSKKKAAPPEKAVSETSSSTASAATSPPPPAPAPAPAAASAVAASLPQPAPTPGGAPVAASAVAAAAVAAATKGSTPQAPQQQHLWGELVKRYDSMWNATQIPAIAAGLRAPLAAASTPASLASTATSTSTNSAVLGALETRCALAAAAAARNAPAPMPPLVVSIPRAQTSNARQTAAALSALSALGGAASTTSTAAALGQSVYGSLLSAAAAAAAPQSAAPAPVVAAQHPRRKPTLDDLCSILSGEKFYAKTTGSK